MADKYIVICAQVVGSGPFHTEYASDGKKFAERADAISHGFTLGRSDDFNIGVLRNDALISLDWMDQFVDSGAGVLAKIAAQVSL
jgi:hypothetical protein